MQIAIIGAGLIGKKRALALPQEVRLTHICDVAQVRCDQFATEFQCTAVYDWKEIIDNPALEAVIIATPNKHLAEIGAAAIKAGKHVLIEKPGARNRQDLQQLVDAYRKRNVVVMFGYNHRYHPAIQKAKEIVDSKEFGEVLFIRAKYGHGGRPGYEREWRFNEEISGGGQLLDQGSHLIDLTNHFAGELTYHSGTLETLFWDTPLEDSAFLVLKGQKTIANLVTTCLEWKNIFCLEIMLKTGKLQIDGLGRSYGIEKLTVYKMLPQMGPPDIQEYVFEGEDTSWNRENEIFFKKIEEGRIDDTELMRAEYVLRIINDAYGHT